MTELDFLLELLLDHQLPEKSQKSVRARIKAVQRNFSAPIPMQQPRQLQQAKVVHGALQAPSMAAKIEQLEVPNPTPIIAATPATQAAMASRALAVQAAISGKDEKGRTSPRKF